MYEFGEWLVYRADICSGCFSLRLMIGRSLKCTSSCLISCGMVRSDEETVSVFFPYTLDKALCITFRLVEAFATCFSYNNLVNVAFTATLL